MANLPNYISEIIPYSRVLKRKNGFRASVGGYIARSKYLIANEFGVDPDKVHDIFLRAWDKSEKDYPSPSVSFPQNSREAESYNNYVLYIWQYYVEDKSKPKPPPKEPKLPKVKKPVVEEPEEKEEEQGEFLGYGDEDDLIDIALKAKKQEKQQKPGALAISEKMYEGTRGTDLVDEEIDERILRLLGLEDVFDIDYDTYISLLRGWVEEARMTNTSVSTEESELVTDEFRRVRRKVGRFKINKKSMQRGDAPPLQGAKNFITGAPDQEQKLLPPAPEPRKPRKASLEENIAAIRKTVESILKLMEGQYKAIRKQLENERNLREKKKRSTREGNLEKKIKKTASLAKKILTPSIGFLERIFDFLKAVFIGRVLYKLVDYISDPKNQEKIQSLIRFIGDWWPALLAGVFLFTNPIGRVIRTVLGTLTKLTLKIAKKGIPMLLRFIAANPITSALVLGSAGAFFGAKAIADRNERMREEENKKDDAGTVTPAETAATGEMPSAGQLYREQMNTRGFGGFFKGGGPIRRTMPNGGKITPSTGKRVRGAGKDTQMIVAQPGEVVISKKAVDKYGAPFFLNLNKMGGGTNVPSFAGFGNLKFAGGGLVKQPQGGVHPPLAVGERIGNGIHKVLTEPMSRYPGGPRYQMVSSDIGSGQERRWIDNPYDPKFKKDGKTLEQRLSERPSSGMLWGDGPMDRTKTESKPKPRVQPRSSFVPMPNMAPSGKDEETEKYGADAKPPSVSSGSMAPFSGVLPQTDKAKQNSTAVKNVAQTRTNRPSVSVPPPPTKQLNVISSRVASPAPKGQGSSGSGDREIDDFDAFQQTESRMTNIAIYGLLGVE